MTTTYQVILAEAHVHFRREIKKIINEIPDVEVVAEVGECNELFKLLETSLPDLVILDISLPNLRAMKATQIIKANYPKVKVIIMIMDGGNEYLTHAVASGADSILLKQGSADGLGIAIQKLRNGEQYFPDFEMEVEASPLYGAVPLVLPQP